MKKRNAADGFVTFVMERVEVTVEEELKEERYAKAIARRDGIQKKIMDILQEHGYDPGVMREFNASQYECDYLIYQRLYLQGMTDSTDLTGFFPKKISKLM